jgi:hypothetical protein
MHCETKNDKRLINIFFYIQGDNESGEIENATHNTLATLTWIALLPIILFVTTDIYEKVEIRRLKCIRTMRKET